MKSGSHRLEGRRKKRTKERIRTGLHFLLVVKCRACSCALHAAPGTVGVRHRWVEVQQGGISLSSPSSDLHCY